MSLQSWNVRVVFLLGGWIAIGLGGDAAWAQQQVAERADSTLTFEQLPGYEGYQEVSRMRGRIAQLGRAADVRWSDDGRMVAFRYEGDTRQLDLSTGEFVDVTVQAKDDEDRSRRRRGSVPRAEQRTVEPSPDGRWNAVYRDFNVVLEPTDQDPDAEAIQVTDTGTERLRYGTGCWVYGEELSQQDAMWWSPDSRLLAFYEINEVGMQDFFLTENNTGLYPTLNRVRYPKSGFPNPKVNLLVYDLTTQATVRLKIDGPPDQYLYQIRFAPNANKLLVNRTNRHQNKLDVLLIDPADGSVSTVVSETQEAWQENSPLMQFLEDGQRFIWETERTGWKRFELRDLDGRRLNGLGEDGAYPCESIVKVDEAAGWVYFTAYSGEHPYSAQLHRVRLDGTEHQRITSSELHHSGFEIAPDHQHVVCVREQFDTPPETVVYNMQGEVVATLVAADESFERENGLSSPEIFQFQAADGTTIHGTLQKPRSFDPERCYPLLIDVYGGPSSRGYSSRYSPANPVCELGYVVAKIANRGTASRGKAFETAVYMKLGGPDIEDQADGVRYLAGRPWIDGSRVGIFGHSYGGYMSALAVLKYPEVFHVAVAGAPVTDWKHYDTIYTERYMRTPEENPEGYRQGSCVELAENLKGHLLIVHGLIDDNVHPTNTWDLVKKLQDADRRFDLMIYPGYRHGVGSTYRSLRWEYFHRHLQPLDVSDGNATGSE